MAPPGTAVSMGSDIVLKGSARGPRAPPASPPAPRDRAAGGCRPAGRACAHALGGAAGAPLAGRSTNSSFRIAPACSRGEPGSIQELDYTSATREIGGAAV